MIPSGILMARTEDGLPIADIQWSNNDARPDHRPINMLHRGHDGTVGFATKRGADWNPLFSIPASELNEVFPEFIAPIVDEDGYFTINGMMPAHAIKEPPSAKRLRSLLGKDYQPPKTARYPVVQNNALRYLTACFLDFDFYNLPDMTLGRAIGVIIDAQIEGLIPPPSMMIDSGRGLWSLWILRDDQNPRMPVRQDSKAVGAFTRIQRELGRRLTSIEPDFNAMDCSRWMRVPGSSNTKETPHKPVRWWVQGNEGGPITYELNELAAMLGTKPYTLPDQVKRSVSPEEREKKQRGYRALHQGRVDKMLMLLEVRGTIGVGMRSIVCTMLASFLHCMKIESCEVEALTLKAVHQYFEQPDGDRFTEAEARACVKTAKKPKRWNDHSISGRLGITEDEAAIVGWPEAGDHGRLTDAINPSSRADRQATRQSLIRVLIHRTGGQVPPLQVIHQFVHQWGGTGSVQTISAELVRMGIKNPRRRKPASDEPRLV